MLPGVIIGLVALSFVALTWFRAWFAPAVMYPAYWAFIVLGMQLLPIGDHRVSDAALLVFLGGAVAFVAGSAAISMVLRRPDRAMLDPRWQTTPERKRVIQNGILLYSAVLMAIVPAFIAAVRAAGDALGIDDFGTAARLSLGLADRAGIPQYFQSATSLGVFLAYYAACIYEGGRRDKLTLGAITLASLAMTSLTFGRSPVVALLIGVLSILALQSKISTRTVTLAFAGTIALAVSIGAMLNKGPDLGSGKSPVRALVDNLAIYFIGGPVGFSVVMDDPAYVGEPGLSLRGPKKVLAWVGMKFELPQDVHDYPASDLGNVFSFYYPYWFDGRWFGALFAAFMAGLVATWVYETARGGHPLASAASGLVVGSILTSAVGDGFFSTPMQWLLIVTLGVLLWRFPIRTGGEAADPLPAPSR